MNITDVFTQFDIIDKKGFDSHEIIGALSSVEVWHFISPK